MACDDGSLYRIAAEAPPLKLGQLTHRADSMIAWNGSSGLHLFVGDQVSSKIHAYGLDFGGSALTSLTAAETTVPPIWLRSMSMSGSDRLLIGAPGEDTIMLLDPDSLVEGVAPELDLIKVPPTSRMELGDVDGDDSTELVALQEKRLLIISLSETSSRVIAEISLSPEADIDGPLAIWDADCDGHLDVAVRSRSMKQVIAWRGDGLGGFEPVGELYSPDSLHFLVGGPRCSRSGQSLLGIGEAEVFLR